MTAYASFAVFSALAVPAAIGPGPSLPLVGVSVNTSAKGSSAAIVRDLAELRRMGARLLYVSVKWSQLEPRPGRYELKPVTDAVNGAKLLGFRLLITVQTIDTNNRTLPSDLERLPFGDRHITARFLSLLRAVGPALTKEVEWVMLGNEADVYLAAHPAELKAFASMVESGREVLRGFRKDLVVGVTVTFDGMRNLPALVRRLNEHMDVLALTYYPLNRDFTVRPPGDVPRDVQSMVDFARGKPIVLQEAGYPAGIMAGSSDDAQARFVDALFQSVRQHAASFKALNYFLLYDFGDEMVNKFVAYYGVSGQRFRAFLGTLGLKRSDGSPRAAWDRFLQQLAKWRERAPE